VAAKQTFLTAFKKKNKTFLTRAGRIWTKDYNVSKVDSSTNPLLLVSNGGFIVKSYTAGSSMTLVRNARYSSGPAMATRNPIRTVVIKVITDNTAAVQALRNGDIDLYFNTLPTNNDKLALSAMRNVTTLTNVGGNYSFIHLRVSNAAQEKDVYSGPFAGNSQKAKDLRRAFMLAMPREQMIQTLIAPIKPDAKPLDTQFAFQGTPEYNTLTRASGVSEFTRGTQAQRTAQALALVQKHFPSASATNAPVKISFVHANVGLRNQLAAIVAAEAKKAGFDVVSYASANIFGLRDNLSAKHDVSMYGFGLTAIAQANATGIFKSDGPSNTWGWNNPELDKILLRLQNEVLTAAQVTKLRTDADKIIMSEYWGLPLYANPTITAYNKALKGVKPAPIGNNVTWNYFQWSY
jgi:peptide/nickel transport system substrate-binding protein